MTQSSVERVETRRVHSVDSAHDFYTLIADISLSISYSTPVISFSNSLLVIQGVMVRLMLVLAPVMCIVSGVAASSLLSLHVKDIEPKVEKHEKKKKHENNLVFRSEVRIL